MLPFSLLFKCILLSRSTILRQWKMSEILVDLVFLPKTCARCTVQPPKRRASGAENSTLRIKTPNSNWRLQPLGSWFGLSWCNMQDAWSALCESAIQRGSKAETEGVCLRTPISRAKWESVRFECWMFDVFQGFQEKIEGETCNLWNERWFFGLNTEAYRSKQIFDIWTEVWSGQRNRLKYVISTQAAPWRQNEDEITVKGRSTQKVVFNLWCFHM